MQKARDAGLAAVQHYNNPTAVFKSGNYIVLMVIAYTALFHATFEHKGIEYQIKYRRTGQPKLINGEPMLKDALECAKIYATTKTATKNGPMVANLAFFFPLRHKIEHRFMPLLDPAIAGHCQALLMNFDDILSKNLERTIRLIRLFVWLYIFPHVVHHK